MLSSLFGRLKNSTTIITDGITLKKKKKKEKKQIKKNKQLKKKKKNGTSLEKDILKI